VDARRGPRCGKMYILNFKKILRSTTFELLNHVKGYSINDYFLKLVISVTDGHLYCFPQV
jgi:hypothetical protein